MQKVRELPPQLLAAAGIVFLHGTVGLATITYRILTDGQYDGILRPTLNALTMLCIAWGLLTRQTWGWWLGVLIVGFRAALAVVALGAVTVLSFAEPEALELALLAIENASGQPVLWSLAWLVFLVAAFVLLMSPPTRAVFRTRRAEPRE